MFRSRVVRIDALVHAGALEHDKLVAALMNNVKAGDALEALLPEAPDELLAMRTKGGLLKEPELELVILHLEDIPLLEGTLPGPGPRVLAIHERVRR